MTFCLLSQLNHQWNSTDAKCFHRPFPMPPNNRTSFANDPRSDRLRSVQEQLMAVPGNPPLPIRHSGGAGEAQVPFSANCSEGPPPERQRPRGVIPRRQKVCGFTVFLSATLASSQGVVVLLFTSVGKRRRFLEAHDSLQQGSRMCRARAATTTRAAAEGHVTLGRSQRNSSLDATRASQTSAERGEKGNGRPPFLRQRAGHEHPRSPSEARACSRRTTAADS